MSSKKTIDKRKHERHSPEYKALLNFEYTFEADLDISPLDRHLKYEAVVKNVSTEGICFHSSQKLEKGERLNLEFRIPGGDKPVHMEGQVRWSKTVLTEEKKSTGYDTGVKLTTIENRSVHDSIRFDTAYHVYWSDVLESIIGQFKTIQQKKRNSQPSTVH